MESFVNTREAERKLGLGYNKLHELIVKGVIASPPLSPAGDRLWRPCDIERVRKVLATLPRVRPGRPRTSATSVSA